MTYALEIVVLYICCSPLYGALALVSFDYFALKFRASDRDVADFMRPLTFPVSLLLLGKLHQMEKIVFEGKTSSNANYLDYLQTQGQLAWKRIMTAVISCLPLPFVVEGVIGEQRQTRIVCLVAFIVVYFSTLIVSFRFGHKLGKMSDEAVKYDHPRP